MQKAHLTIVQGTPFEFLIRVTQKNEENESIPFPLTGCSIELQARSHVSSSISLLNLSSDEEEITIDEEEGTALIRLTSIQTSALDWVLPDGQKASVFHCEIHPPDGDDIRILEGTLKLDREVVR